MHHTEIDHEATVQNAGFDLEKDHLYGYRPVLLEGFAMVDGCDLLVPAPEGHPESMIMALTEKQAMQALLALAGQIGRKAAMAAVTEAEE